MRRTVLLAAAALAAPAPAFAEGVRGPVLATPLPGGPGVTLPGTGPLAAPVITPAGTTSHGRQLFDIVPAGWERDAFRTTAPARYTSGACDDPVSCSSAGWVSFDFLLWATQGPAAAPLVTTGPAALGPGFAGAVGQPGTAALFGGGRVLNDVRPGFRFDFFLPIPVDGRWGFGTRFDFLGQSADTFTGVGGGANVVAIPRLPVPTYVGFPGGAAGTVTASTQTDFFGAEHHLRHVVAAGDVLRLDGLIGYRYLHLGDRVASSWDVFAPTDAPALAPPAGPRFQGEDGVRTRNDFHGGVIGLAPTARFDRLTVSGRVSVALGETVSVRDGSRTRVTVPGLNAGGLAGLIPVVTERTGGGDASDLFAVVPEAMVKVGWRATDHFHLTAGYTFTYWSRVRRAQEQYDLGPVLTGRTTDFWAQGLNLGLEFRY